MTIQNPGQPQSASSQAVTALVLSILGIVCCQILAPISWYLGKQELNAIREGRSSAAGEGIAKAAYIIGIIGTVWMALILCWIFFAGGLAILSSLSSGMGR